MRIRLLLAILVLFGLLAAACGDDDDAATEEQPTAAPEEPTAAPEAPTEEPGPEPSPTVDFQLAELSEAGETMPLTGGPLDEAAAAGPAIAAKIDNIADAMPQAGIADADVIVEVLVEGRLKLNQWETPEGQKRSRLTVVVERFQFVGGRGGDGGGAAPRQAGGGQRQQADQPSPDYDESPPPPSDDDIPF